MVRLSLFEACHQQLDQLFFSNDWSLNYLESQNCLELFLYFELDNPLQLNFEDASQANSCQDPLPYCLKVAIYSKYQPISQSLYWVALEIDPDKGIEHGELKAFLKTVKDQSKSLSLAWKDWYQADRSFEFDFAWDWKAYRDKIALYQETGRYDNRRLFLL